ncbi:hypothetical protein [Halosimplex salinum]|uniref:hypothetical protein n=1 Tax=Halosimplex salinum TaxID=1710538 RepID=UPI000F4A35A4|nr:hypothetical protein [Halosimplex salinum]
MIHKKILDVARSNPDASLTAISEMVSGASETFVERVLEEYGDPATTGTRPNRGDEGDEPGHDGVPSEQADSDMNGISEPDPTEESGTDTITDTGGTNGDAETEADLTIDLATVSSEGEATERPVVDPSELTEKQLETLRAVHRDPTATQETIAGELGVTRATISKRVNEIPGFDWADRRAFVRRLFDSAPAGAAGVDYARPGRDATVQTLRSRVASLEERLDERGDSGGECALDPDLTHKMVHACMDADYVSKEEELQILRQVL